MRHGKKTFIIAVLILCIINSSFKCRKQIFCAETIYNFEIGIIARPNLETINLGDTIWLYIDESNLFKDMQTGQLITYGDAANLGSAIGFQKLDSTGQFNTKAANMFHFMPKVGIETRNVDSELFREYLFEEKNKRYIFKLGVVPKQSGTFRLVFSNAANVYRENDKCTKASFTLNFKETDQHYYLHPNFQGGPTPIGGDYYFKVN